MDKDSLIERFEAVNDGGCMLKKAFMLLLDASPTSASSFLDAYEGINTYNNYVCEEEALKIAKAFENADGTTGPKWSPDVLFDKIEEPEEEPFYNRWSLWLTMNMEHSNHYLVLKKWSDGDADKYVEACYDLAVSQLKDADRPNWIREYFHID